MWRRHCLCLVLGLLVAGSALAKERTWTNVDGFEMKAEFVREVDGVVTFLKDGKLITLPLDKLCEEDRKLIGDLAMGKPLPEEEPSEVEDTGERAESSSASEADTPDTEEEPPSRGKVTIEERTWEDTSGNKTYAKFVRIVGTEVVLLRTSKVIRISYYSLSKEDQKYVNDILTQQGKADQIPGAGGAETGLPEETGIGDVPEAAPTGGFPTGPPGMPGLPGRSRGRRGPGMGPARVGGYPRGPAPSGGMAADGFPGGGLPGAGSPGEGLPRGGLPPGTPRGAIPPVAGFPEAGGLAGSSLPSGPPEDPALAPTGLPDAGPGLADSGPMPGPIPGPESIPGPGLSPGFGNGAGPIAAPGLPSSSPTPAFPEIAAVPSGAIPAPGGFQQVYRCSGCNREITAQESSGTKCPHCGTLWIYKEDGTGNKKFTGVASARSMAVGLIVVVGIIVLGAVGGFIGIIAAIVRAACKPPQNYRRW